MKEAKAKTSRGADRAGRPDHSSWEVDNELLASDSAEDGQHAVVKSGVAEDSQRIRARRRLEQHLEAKRLSSMLRDVFSDDDVLFSE